MIAAMWFYYAILSAFLNSFSTLARKTHGSLAHPMELCWWTLLFGIPLGIGLMLSSNEPHYTSLGFIIPATLSALLGIASSSLAFYAYQKGETSAVAPIANFLPVMMVLTSFVFLGTFPSIGGLIGIVMVVVGVYYSSLGKAKINHPLQQIFRSKASRAMLACVILWSFGANLDKLAINDASPAFVLAYRQVISFVVLSGILLLHPMRKRLKRGQKVMQRWGWHILAVSVFATLAVYFQFQAVKLTDPAYVVAVKRVDILFTILLAHFLYKEKHVLRRFEGSLVAVAGVVLICLTA
jgi:drug/metabolite transporter (DMT)-like permease